MRAYRYFRVGIIIATYLFFLMWQTAAAGPPEKPGNPGLPGCLAEVSELEDRIKTLEDMLQNFAPVPQTGQKSCWIWDGDEIDCEGTGQDGELQKGVQWPDPRFTDNGDGTVTDHLTALIWLKNADCFGHVNWESALSYSNNLADGQCGLGDDSFVGDWRLPNIRELFSLIDYSGTIPALPPGHPFTQVQSGFDSARYWSSTTFVYGSIDVFCAHMHMGLITTCNKIRIDPTYVWPVRGGN